MNKILEGKSATLKDLALVGADGCDLGKGLVALARNLDPEAGVPIIALAEAMVDCFNSVLNFVEYHEDRLQKKMNCHPKSTQEVAANE